MKAIAVEYEAETDRVDLSPDARQEEWPEICARFNDDVHRVKGVSTPSPYTALYACYDDDNRVHHFLVAEDRQALFSMRHDVFLSKLGRK